MLVLTRRQNESIHIGDEVVITVMAIKRNEVELGFKAPRTVAVHRSEVYQRIQAEKNDSDSARLNLKSKRGTK